MQTLNPFFFRRLRLLCFIGALLSTAFFLLAGCRSHPSDADNSPSAIPTFIDITMSTNQPGNFISLSPDGTRLASLRSSRLTIYDTKTGKILSQAGNVPSDNNIDYITLEFSVDNIKILLSSSGYHSFSQGNSSLVFDISKDSATQLVAIAAGKARLYDDGSKIIAMSRMSSTTDILSIYSTANGSVIKELYPPFSYHFDSLGGNFGLIKDEDAIIFPKQSAKWSDGDYNYVWSVSIDTFVRKFSTVDTSLFPTYRFSVSADGLVAASGSPYYGLYGLWAFYDTKTGQQIGSRINIVSKTWGFHPPFILTKNFVYVADLINDSSAIKIIKLLDGTSTVLTMPSSNYLPSITASRDGRYVAGAVDNIVRIWKLY